MSEHSSDSIKLARMFGNEPNDVYGEPAKDVETPQGFQEEVATVEELLAELPPIEEVAEEIVEEEVVEEEIEAPSLIDRLKTVIDGEAEDDIKTTAEELMARLEELSAAQGNAETFLSENEAVTEEVAEVAEGEEVVAEEVAEEIVV